MQQTLSDLSVEQTKRLRGKVLELLYRHERRQEQPLDHISLWGALRAYLARLNRNQVREVLVDLAERGYVRYHGLEDEETGYVAFQEIKITPAGRDLVEKTSKDAAVRVE